MPPALVPPVPMIEKPVRVNGDVVDGVDSGIAEDLKIRR
jgi:hypothetical protein